MGKFSLAAIQKTLVEFNLDGWLFYDYRGTDVIGRSILNLSDEIAQTRRWFYYIPHQGVPVKIVHSIEREILDHLPGKKQVYLGWEEMEKEVDEIFSGGEKVAVQYSPKGAIPYVSRMDAGTFEFLKNLKIKLESSADLLQIFEASWSGAQLNTHKNAAKQLHEIIKKAFRFINNKIKTHEEITEFSVQKYLMTEMRKRGLIFDHPPIVAVGKNSGIPHYFPSDKRNSTIYPGALIQINLWAKEKSENAVYAVVAWVGFLGKEVPEDYADKFSLICKARDEAIAFIDKSIKKGKVIHGWEVDDLVREKFRNNGYESYFLHRTGHSVGREVNDTGVNIDNLETRDERQIIPKTCFSIEPALYFSDYGMRSEVNVYVDKKGAHVYTLPIQTEIVPIMK